MKLAVQNFHFNRYQVERRDVLAHLLAFKEADESMQWGQQMQSRYDQFFSVGMSDFNRWEVIHRESQWRDDLRDWEMSGAAVFSFHDDLVRMFIHTDVMDVPIATINFPYSGFYCYLGDSDPIPGVFPDYRIDGFYVGIGPWKDLKGGAVLLVSVEFTLVRLSGEGGIRPLTTFGLIVDPFLRADYLFDPAHRTVREAIDNLYRESGVPMGHHFLDHDPYGDVIIDPADKGWRRGEKGSLFRLNSYLNVTNRPEHLEALTRLVFNALCYLNWKDRDVVVRYPSDKVQTRVDNARNEKERKRAESKAKNMGYRQVHFCGYRTVGERAEGRSGASPAAHWRRGHWRCQPTGAKRASTKLIWIKPTIVNKAAGVPCDVKVYRVEG